MKIKFYVLGIQRNFRGGGLLADLQAAGVTAEVIWGIDAREVDISQDLLDNEKAFFLYGRTLSPNEVACTLGHKLILEKTKDDGTDLSVILEDDVEIKDVQSILSRLHEIALIATPSIFFLITHERLSLRFWSFSRGNRIIGVKRIYSNPGGTVAYVLNKQASEKLAELPADTWKGVQADFPPLYFEYVKMYSLSGLRDVIKLQDIESLIGERQQRKLNIFQKQHIFVYRIYLCFASRNRRFGLGISSYCAHFFARGIAWRLSGISKSK